MNSSETHSELGRRDQDVKLGSNRSFGVVFTLVFVIIAIWPLLNGENIRLWAVAVAVAFLAVALIAPGWLSPVNRIWFRFGLLLHRIVSPIIMGLVFFLTVTPIALIMKLFGKIPLSLQFDAAATSYWIKREPPGAVPDTMKNQF
ncbi:MAG: SxtJ family membrane protein [Rhodospirillaceae bacterium]